VLVLVVLALEVFLKVLDEVWSILALNQLLVTELSVDGNGVAGLTDAGVDAGLVKEG
jgi:hypothetical protein